MKNGNAITKWMGGAVMAAALVFGFSHKAEAQQVSFGVQIGAPVAVYPQFDGAYAYRDGYIYQGRYYCHDDWYRYQQAQRARWEHERWERERHWDRDRYYGYGRDNYYGRGYYDRDRGYDGYRR